MKPFEIVSGCVFGIGLLLFALAGLASYSYWVGASIAAIGLVALLIFIALRPKSGDRTPAEAKLDEEYGLEEKHLMPSATRNVKCPQCGEPTQVARGEKPSCENCGFS